MISTTRFQNIDRYDLIGVIALYFDVGRADTIIMPTVWTAGLTLIRVLINSRLREVTMLQ